MPILLERFFATNFNIIKFKDNNDYLIREYIIKNYKNFDENKLLYHIDNMIAYVNTNIPIKQYKISFDNNFPDKEILCVFMPFLKYYLNMMLSYEDIIKIKNKYALLFNMKRFIHYNPLFGRRIKCVHFRKLYYISVLHHQYDNSFNNMYIPKPSLFNIHKRTFFISEYKNDIYSFFPNVDCMNFGIAPEITNTIDIIKFARTYIFNVEQNEIIQKHIVHKYNELNSYNVIRSNTKYKFLYNNFSNRTNETRIPQIPLFMIERNREPQRNREHMPVSVSSESEPEVESETDSDDEPENSIEHNNVVNDEDDEENEYDDDEDEENDDNEDNDP